MDIFSHTFSGLAIGATAIHFSNKEFSYNSILVLTCGVAAFFPDLDVISQWSGFDAYFGKWFDLQDSGKIIYHQKRWFSHHALFHSLLMACSFTGLVFVFFKLFSRKEKLLKVFMLNKVFLIAVFSAYLIHLLEDMPTPDFVWGGIALLFPSENYWGGKGYIWWWNNYDLFLIIVSVFVINLLVKFSAFVFKFGSSKMAAFILLLGVSFYLRQMLTRPYDFNYSSMKQHHEVWQINELKSKEIQKEILGDDLYRLMESLDNSIPFWF